MRTLGIQFSAYEASVDIFIVEVGCRSARARWVRLWHAPVDVCWTLLESTLNNEAEVRGRVADDDLLPGLLSNDIAVEYLFLPA